MTFAAKAAALQARLNDIRRKFSEATIEMGELAEDMERWIKDEGLAEHPDMRVMLEGMREAVRKG